MSGAATAPPKPTPTLQRVICVIVLPRRLPAVDRLRLIKATSSESAAMNRSG